MEERTRITRKFDVDIELEFLLAGDGFSVWWEGEIVAEVTLLELFQGQRAEYNPVDDAEIFEGQVEVLQQCMELCR